MQESRRSMVFSQMNSQEGDSSGSVTRIETTYGQPTIRTISMTKIYHPGRTTSIKRMDGISSPLRTTTLRQTETSERAVKNLIQSGVSINGVSNVSNVPNILIQNQNHVLRVSRAEPLIKQTIVGEINPRLSFSLDQTRSLIQRTVIIPDGGEYNEVSGATRSTNQSQIRTANRAKVVIHGHGLRESQDGHVARKPLKFKEKEELVQTDLNSTQQPDLIPESNIKSRSPQSLIEALANEINQEESGTDLIQDSDIFGSIQQPLSRKLKNSASNQSHTLNPNELRVEDFKDDATKEDGNSFGAIENPQRRIEDFVEQEEQIKASIENPILLVPEHGEQFNDQSSSSDKKEHQTEALEAQAIPGKNLFELTLGNETQGRSHHRQGSYDEIIEQELQKIHQNINDMIYKTESDLKSDGDVRFPRGNFGLSSQMLNHEEDLSLSIAEKSQYSTKNNSVNRAKDHDYAKQAYEGSYKAIFNKQTKTSKSQNPKTGLKTKSQTMVNRSQRSSKNLESETEQNLASYKQKVKKNCNQVVPNNSKKEKKNSQQKLQQQKTDLREQSNNLSDYQDQYHMRSTLPKEIKQKKRFYDPSHTDAIYENSLLQKMIQEKEQKYNEDLRRQKELQGCTFQPKINKTKLKGLSKFMERQQRWLQMREMKTEMLSDAQMAKNDGQCTFQPETNSKQFENLAQSLVSKQNDHSVFISGISQTRKTQSRRLGSSKPSVTQSQFDAVDLENNERETLYSRNFNPTYC